MFTNTEKYCIITVPNKSNIRYMGIFLPLWAYYSLFSAYTALLNLVKMQIPRAVYVN